MFKTKDYATILTISEYSSIQKTALSGFLMTDILDGIVNGMNVRLKKSNHFLR